MIRAVAAIGVLVASTAGVAAQDFDDPTHWDVVPVADAAFGGGQFGKALVLRASHESVADVAVRQGSKLHLLREPGNYKHTLLVPLEGTLNDFGVLPFGDAPDVLVVATSSGVSFFHLENNTLVPEPFTVAAPIERVAAGPSPVAPGHAALALWAPSISKILLFDLHQDPSTGTTQAISYAPRSFSQLAALAVLDFDGDPTPDVAAAYPAGLRVFSFAGPLLRTVLGTGTLALTPFRVSIPDDDPVGALAWLRQSGGSSILAAIGDQDFGPNQTFASQSFFAVTACEEQGVASRLVMTGADGAIALVGIGQPPAVLGSKADTELTNAPQAWTLLHEFDCDPCDDLVDFLTFDDDEFDALVHRGRPSLQPATCAMGLQSLDANWSLLSELGFHVVLDDPPPDARVQIRVWAWPDFDVFEGDPTLMAEDSFEPGPGPFVLHIEPPSPIPDGLIAELRLLRGSETEKLLVVLLNDDETQIVPWTPDEICDLKAGDPRGITPVPGVLPNIRQP